MTHLRLLLRSLAHFWRGNLAVGLGVAIACAVLTGALLVGDSLQGSLRAQSARRLGWVTRSLVAQRFFRDKLAEEVARKSGGRASPLLLLQATVSLKGGAQARGVTILGVEPGFFGRPQAVEGAWLSSALARALDAKAGDEVTLHLQKPGEVPREAGLGKKEAEARDWTLKVGRLLAEKEDGDAFDLRPRLEAPRNLFVPLAALQEHLGLVGSANALIADGAAKELDAALEASLALEDWGLVLRSPASRARDLVAKHDTDGDGKLGIGEWRFSRAKIDGKARDVPRYAHHLEDIVRPASRFVRTVEDFRQAFQRSYPYLSLESKSLLIPPALADAALSVAKKSEMAAAPTLVYLCRWDIGGKRSAGVVAASDDLVPGLGKREIALVGEGKAGETVTLRYKPAESQGPTKDETREFAVAKVPPLAGALADPFLTPDFPGITDRDDLGTWNLPFEDEEWKRNISAEYGDPWWKRLRGTPKAHVSLATGQELWGSKRFGSLTSIRLRGDEAKYRAALLEALWETGGFAFEDTAGLAARASGGAQVFGLLFLGFSFFLIAAALLLVVLLFRLNLDRRGPQAGLLLAQGFRLSTVRLLYLAEGGLVALAGVALGGFLAVLYSRLLLRLLADLWPGGALKSFLEPHASLFSLAVGIGGSFLASAAAIAWSVRALGRVPPRALLAGQSSEEAEQAAGGWIAPSLFWGGLPLGLLLILLGPRVPGAMAQALTFFGAGAAFLTAGLAGVRLMMRWKGGPVGRSVARMALRNAARHPLRSLLAVGLLASSTFVIVAVESFRRQAKAGDGSKDGPDGGFALVAETDLPVIKGVRDIIKSGGLEGTEIIALRARAGDDVSCLNLYKPTAPRVLGVPRALIERGGFQFDAGGWDALQGEGIPALGESNTVTYMLGSKMGGEVKVEGGTVRIAGLLHDSVFQSSLLVSEEDFLKLYPEEEGYRYFLIAPPAGHEKEVKAILERGLRDKGIEVSFTADRLASYLAVENTYLTTFQALGGLGLVLGSLGLAVVLLRSVWERRAELALLRALGWRRWLVGWLVLAENAALLLGGLALG
ncbi:MAG: hypothetical protein K2W96_12875, partial [Gemmataceae bacterium]|nr:hypothetical protein [Gemmataceae bacterium]